MNQLLRYALGAGLVLLVGWLALDSSPAESKWKAIDEELARGTIGKLSPEETALLQETIQWIAPQAGITGAIIINRKSQPGGLHVYSTTPEAIAVTGCARGNAIYNASLDAVFIDEEILYPKEIPMLGEKSPSALLELKDFTFIPVYLRFILLHELGHRQLHRRSGGFFDISGSSRKIEQEADDFAVSRLRSAYKADLATGGKRVGEGAAEFIQLNDTKLTVGERVWVDLVSSVSTMSQALMFSASNFSSFYEDTAHPNFIKRAIAILDAAIASPENSPALKAHAAIYRRNLYRMQSLAGSEFAEIQLSEGVQKVTFDAGSLLAMTNRGHIFALPLDKVDEAVTRKDHLLRQIQPTVTGPYKSIDEDEAFLSEMWAHPKVGPIIIRPEKPTDEVNAVTIQGDRFSLLSALRNEIRKDGRNADLYTPPQPADVAILETHTGGDEQYIIVRNGTVSNRLSINAINQICSIKLKLASVKHEIGTVTDSIAYLTIFERQGTYDKIYGVAQLDLFTGKLRSVIPLLFQDEKGYEMWSIAGDRLVVVPRRNEPLYVLLTRNRNHFISSLLSNTKPIKRLAEQAFLFDSVLIERNITGGILGHFDPELTDARLLPTGQILVVFSNDSVYSVDVTTGKTVVVFSPGTALQASVSRLGYVAFFTPNGRKIYVIKPTTPPL